MRPKIKVRPMPSSAYVPPSTRPFSRCCRKASMLGRGERAPDRPSAGATPPRTPRPATPRCSGSLLREEVRERDLPVLDLDDEDRRLALAAFLAGGAVLLELDRAVHAGERHFPERLLDGLRLVLAGDLHRLGDGRDAVVAAEALGQALEGMAALGPLVDEGLGELAIRHR